MFNNRKIFAAIFSLSILSSCYHKELKYSFETSYGGVSVGPSYYYLAQVREFMLPNWISRLPDGGRSKEIRQLFGLFLTDSMDQTTVLVAKLNDVVGWKARFATRLDYNQSIIAIGIKNVNFPDSVDGVYLYNLKSKVLKRYNKEKALPALSPVKSEIAYCIGNKLCIDDYSTNTSLYSYLLNSEPVFISWKSEKEILLFYSDPFHVKVLNLENGRVLPSDLKYIPNYNQNLDATTLNKMIKKSNPDLKGLLDKK